MIAFLSSPVRVFTAFNRAVVAFCLIAPFVVFGWQGIYAMPLSISLWLIVTLSVYGPTAMIYSNPPWRVWFWRHIEMWWVNPEQPNNGK